LLSGPNLGQRAGPIVREDDAVELARLGPIDEEQEQAFAVTSGDAVGRHESLVVGPLVERPERAPFSDADDPIAIRGSAESLQLSRDPRSCDALHVLVSLTAIRRQRWHLRVDAGIQQGMQASAHGCRRGIGMEILSARPGIPLLDACGAMS
jgi:hypothetical protein